MEIKQVKDLIPYRVSLKELWEEERFQPVKALLYSTYEESVLEFRALKIGDDPKIVGRIVTLQERMNFSGLMYDLPNTLKQLEDQNYRISEKVKAMGAAQEGGTI